MEKKFIVIEGIDGSGGETQSKLLYNYLKERGRKAVRITYPDYENPIGRLIHEYLHEKYEFSPEIQFLLYASDMIKDKEKIKDWLEKNYFVIADRYFTSTIVYQGLQGFGIKKALKFAELFEIIKPDIIVYLKISPETSIKRKMKEKKELDRNEENKEFLRKVSEFYEKVISDQVFGKWVVIDGEKTKEEVFEEIKKVLEI